jgi:tRNA(fMet)-specific endonuclease VapC
MIRYLLDTKYLCFSLHDEFDLIIGASAIIKNLILVTDNVKHFKRFEGIKIENWFKHL